MISDATTPLRKVNVWCNHREHTILLSRKRPNKGMKIIFARICKDVNHINKPAKVFHSAKRPRYEFCSALQDIPIGLG